ncbi:hypothetical protein EKO04_004556 [Ascochyta lentis]|uniref:Uncharacterized protein n=1 Tax=Ascochyta lentis TaxID=205686 RepID=A0A8H7J697_9PLEO|nr:hypothetical protein EKO04_004556 [Ascochyta lentis]
MGLIYSKAQSVLAWQGADAKIAQFLADPTTSGSWFYAFWSSPYWDRAGITQEIALASRVTLVAGDKELDMELLPFFNCISRDDDINLSRLSALNSSKSHSLRSKSLIQLLHKF